MKHKTALAAQVAAWNRCNAEANKLAVLLAEVFKPFIGKKIICNGGSLTQRAQSAIPELSHVLELNIWHACSVYALHYMVRVCEHEDRGDYCGSRYAETHVVIGQIKDRVLESVNTPCTDLRTDYTESEILAKREALQKAEAALRDAESALSPFKPYDH